MAEQRLFISYANEDEAVVNRIVAYLESRGAQCWIASRDIPPRAIYADAIVEGMQACSACAVIVSAASNASKAVKRELELASHADKPFIPIRIDMTEPTAGLAYYLRNTQWVDFKREGESALDRIAGQVRELPPTTISRARSRSARNRPALVVAGMVALIGAGTTLAWLAWPRLSAERPTEIVQNVDPQASAPTLDGRAAEGRSDSGDDTAPLRRDETESRQSQPSPSPAESAPPSTTTITALGDISPQWRDVIAEANAVAARAEQAAARARDRETAARRWAIQAQRATPGVRTVTTSRGTYAGQTEAIALTWRPHGLGILALSPPRGQRIGGVSAGQWEHGTFLSPGILEFVDERGARTRYEGEFENDLPHGAGVITLADGRRLFGSFERGEMNGWGRLASPEGATYYGQFENTQRNGRGLELGLDNRIEASGSWRGDRLISP